MHKCARVCGLRVPESNLHIPSDSATVYLLIIDLRSLALRCRGGAATSMVLRLFGLEVQVPFPPEDDDKSGSGGSGSQKQKQRPQPKARLQAATNSDYVLTACLVRQSRD